jgi:S-formylglutathione hydrolase FrmB
MTYGMTNEGGGPRGRGRGLPGGRGAPATAPATAPAARAGGGRGGFGSNQGFDVVLTQELLPYIDANFRTLADQPHRAMGGLSMGGMETHSVTLAHPDLFAYYALLSGGTYTPTELAPHKDKLKLVFMSCGSFEQPGGVLNAAQALNQAGFKAVSFVSPNTRHEFQTWRRSLHELAPLLFQE